MDSSKFANRSVQIVAGLLLVEIVVFLQRSGIDILFSTFAFVWHCLPLVAGGYYALIAICVVVAAYGFCLPKKLLPVHKLAIVPWLITLEVMMWGGYWAAANVDPHGPRPESDNWLVHVIFAAFFVSVSIWLTLLFLRLREWWRVLVFGGLQLCIQGASSFVAIMAAMNDWL